MSGFMNDAQVEAYLDGLDHEREGYEHRVAMAEAKSDDVAAALYSGRIQQVDDEIKRVKGLGSVESIVDEDESDAAA